VETAESRQNAVKMKRITVTGRSSAFDEGLATQRGTVTMAGDLKSQRGIRIGLASPARKAGRWAPLKFYRFRSEDVAEVCRHATGPERHSQDLILPDSLAAR